MSTDAAELRPSAAEGWRELEDAVARLLETHDALQGRLAAAETRIRELEEALQGVSTGELDPSAMAAELRELRSRNADLTGRMADARAAVERVAGRIRFVEEER